MIVEEKHRSHYSLAVMSKSLPPSDEIWRTEIQQLEHRIHELINLCGNLREENRGLRSKVQRVTSERDQLHEKNEYAIRSVESILASVRVLEKSHE